MNSFRLFDYRARRVVVSVALLLATIVPALVPTFVGAAQVTGRSIALSSSSKAATGVTYTVNFTAVGAAGAFVVDFCSDSPVIGEACTPPSGFSASSAASTSTGFTDVTGSTSKIIVAGTINASDNVSVAITGITNPSAAGPLYARIVTYDTKTDAQAYTSTSLGTGNVDQGSVAVSITDTVGVSGAVLESMTFCAANQAISANCGDAGTTGHEPILKLGETVGSTVALDPDHLSTGDIYTQISTNAVNGAVINLKSGVSCGGLKRVGASTCDIAPAGTGSFTAGTAKFGLKAVAATDTGTNPNGTLQTTGNYNGSDYVLNYVAGDASGVTSVYGDPILNTNNQPANNKNMKLTFGASVANNTPAGNYSADISLIATGKF